jgi:MoaA/NifB/PqqE/SkfB family radical SAM enzyme
MLKPRLKPVTLRRRIAKYVIQYRYASRPAKPALRRRSVANYLSYVLRRRTPLRFCDIAVSYDCNLKCQHCSASRLDQPEGRRMNVRDYQRLGQELVDNGVLAVQLTGGEPLLHPELEEVISALQPSKLFVSLVTNGSRTTRERLRRLQLRGLDNICISLDAWEPTIHDRQRGRPGSHDEALTALETGLDLGLSGMVFHVVTPTNIYSHDLLRLVQYTQRKGVLLVLGWAVPAGNWNGNYEVLLTKEHLLHLESLHERYPHVRTDFETNYFQWGCGAVKEKLYVTSYGDVLPCAFVHIRLGNIFEESLSSIRQRALAVPWFQGYNGRCLAATDPDFLSQHFTKIVAAPKEPITLEEAGLSPA